MSPKLPNATGGGGRVFVTMVMVVLVAAVMLLVVRGRPDPQPFDPRSGADDGATALVLLLEELDTEVKVVRAVPEAADEVRLMVLDDRLNDDQRADVAEFVDEGGLAVVADPDSPLHGLAGAGNEEIEGFVPDFPTVREDVESEINVDKQRCTIAAVSHLRGLFVVTGVRFATAANESTCFGDEDHAVVIAEPRGRGTMVAIGDNSMFTNALIRFADNAGLAAALLAPSPGGEVHILLGSGAAKTAADIGTGERTLSDLVRPGVWMALVQLALAFVLLAIARGVRAGRPVREPSPVPVAGSEFVTANGNLMQRAGHAQRAGWLMRGHLYRELCDRFRLAPTVPIDVVDQEVALRTGTPPGRVAAVLHREVTDNAGLLQLSRDVLELRTATDPSTTARYPTAPIQRPEGVST